MEAPKKLKGIAGAFSLSALNQIVSSGTNFALGVYLVKILSPTDYGLYGIGIAISLFVGGISNALFLTQMVVNTPNNSSERDKFAASTIANIAIFSLTIAVITTTIFLLAVLCNNDLIKMNSYVFAITGVSVSYIVKEFFVRHAYNSLKESWALYIHVMLAITLVITLTIILILHYDITVVTVFWAYSFAHLCAALFGCLLARLPISKVNVQQLWSEARLSWVGGRWTIISSIVYFARTQAHTIVATALMGPVGVAKLNATRLFVTPPVMLIPALGQVFFPRLARLGIGESSKLYRTASMFAGLLLGVSILYSMVMILSLDYIEKTVLAGKYNSIQFLIVSWCIYICVFSVRSSIDITVQVMKCFKEQMNAYIMSAITAIAATYLMVKYVYEDSYVIGMIAGEVAVSLLLYKVIVNTYPVIGNKLADNA